MEDCNKLFKGVLDENEDIISEAGSVGYYDRDGEIIVIREKKKMHASILGKRKRTHEKVT